MPKSQIIKDVVESAVSLEQSLTRLYVIAGDLNNAKLAQWVSQELHGYKEEKSVPEYRKKHGYFLVYSGINARYQVTNIPLPKDFLSSEIIEAISNITFYDGIHSIEQIAASEKGASRDFSELAGQVSIATKGGVMCTSISQAIPSTIFQSICTEVQLRIIAGLTELEKEYGCLDDLGINISDINPKLIQAQNDKINHVIFNVNIPSPSEQNTPWYSKVAWRIVIPIIVGVLCTVITALVIKFLGL